MCSEGGTSQPSSPHPTLHGRPRARYQGPTGGAKWPRAGYQGPQAGAEKRQCCINLHTVQLCVEQVGTRLLR